MTPSFLLALLPPEQLTGRITAFREKHVIDDAAAFPHVTVKSGTGLMSDLWWVNSVSRLVERTPAPGVLVRGPRLFPNGSAVYLDVQSEDAMQLHLNLLRVLTPPEIPDYEGRNLKLHLTLALQRRSVNLSEVFSQAQTAFTELDATPVSFSPPALTLMCKVGSGTPYEPVEEWLFSTQPADAPPQVGR